MTFPRMPNDNPQALYKRWVLQPTGEWWLLDETGEMGWGMVRLTLSGDGGAHIVTHHRIPAADLQAAVEIARA